MTTDAASSDERWMARALQLAALADHRTYPNPMVGSVVLDSAGGVAGEGWHRAAGEPHAEAVALSAAGNRARGGTLYATLEPCSHHGRTPACADAIVAAGVRRVVVAVIDPDPRVSGAGVARLREAGMTVDVGVGAGPARRLGEMYLRHRESGRPWVTVKFAASLDGRVATAGGESRWISGEESRSHAHVLRHRHPAILVGAGTVAADDPELSARGEGARQPLRVVLDSGLRTSPGARVARAGTVFFAAPGAEPGRASALHATGAEVVEVPAGPFGVDVVAVLAELGRRQVVGVLVEGGPAVHGSFFAAGVVDRVHAYLAPMVIGGDRAPGAVAGPGAARLADAWSLGEVEVERLGADLHVTGLVSRHG